MRKAKVKPDAGFPPRVPLMLDPPNGWPYTWDIQALGAFKGKMARIGGVSVVGFAVEFEARFLEVQGNRIITDHYCKPDLRNIFAVKDLETGKILKCQQLERS